VRRAGTGTLRFERGDEGRVVTNAEEDDAVVDDARRSVRRERRSGECGALRVSGGASSGRAETRSEATAARLGTYHRVRHDPRWARRGHRRRRVPLAARRGARAGATEGLDAARKMK
jgi:hypothetical protein